MPTYKVTDPTTGKSLKLTGDSPPTEQELEEVFAQVHGGQEPEAVPQPPTPSSSPSDYIGPWQTVGEPALQMITGAGSSAVGGLAGLGTLATGGSAEEAAARIKSIQEAGTYQPRSPGGQAVQSYLLSIRKRD
jgi:hypothetical protein